MKIKSLAFILTAVAGLLFSTSVRADDSALMEPVKSVYDNYLKIQSSLARDSIKGVSDEANAISKAVKGDSMKMLPTEVGTQADALAKATDVSSARETFKDLSASLIKYLADNKVKSGSYTEAFCPMANASWLQSSKTVSNPYLGQSMPTCGEIKRTF